MMECKYYFTVYNKKLKNKMSSEIRYSWEDWLIIM